SLEACPPDRVVPGRVALQTKPRIVRDERAHSFDAQPPNIGRSGPLSVPAETARDNGVAPFSSSTVGSAPWASSNLRMAGSVWPAATNSGARPPWGPAPLVRSG